MLRKALSTQVQALVLTMKRMHVRTAKDDWRVHELIHHIGPLPDVSSGYFGIFRDISGFFGIFRDFSGYFGVFRDFSPFFVEQGDTKNNEATSG